MRNVGDYGIAVAEEGRSMKDGRWQNDSRFKKWTVDTEQDPSHLRVFELRGGTKWTMPSGDAEYREEVLFSVKHKMLFPPKPLCFFYVIDGANVPDIGSYSQNNNYMEYSNFLFTEGIFAQVDSENFYIKHFMETFGIFDDGNVVGHGLDFLFRVRFELLNQEAFLLGDKGY